MEKNGLVPILVPIETVQFFTQIREIIREEINKKQQEQSPVSILQIPGLTEKPLYKIQEICTLFKVTKPTVYGWIKIGKLKPVKIRSRVYFLGSDIQQLMQS